MAPRTVADSAPDLQQATVDPYPLETLGHSQASVVQSPVGSLLLSTGSWWMQGFVVPSKSLFPWGFSVLSPDPQVGKSVVGPRTFATVQELLWYNCSPVCRLNGSMLGLMAISSKTTYATHCAS